MVKKQNGKLTELPTPSVEADEVVIGDTEIFEEINLADEEPLDDEGLPEGESFPAEEAFEDYFAGEPLPYENQPYGDEEPLADPAPLAVMAQPTDAEPVTKPAVKPKGEGPRHGRHAQSGKDGKDGKGGKHGDVPEYMRKSRRMRRILIVVIIVLFLLLAALVYFGYQILEESGATAVQQAQTTEQEVNTIENDSTNDASTASAKTTTVPNLASLLGLTQQEAIDKLQHGAQASEPRAVNEEGNPIKTEVRVALTAEPADSRTGTPTVYLGLDEGGLIIQAGYSASTAALGYGSLSFKDAVVNEHIIEKTLIEAGVTVDEDAVQLPADSTEYTSVDTDGKTITKEYCSFSGQADVEGVERTWSAVLSYDYSMANASQNLADTVRTIFVYVNS